MKKLTSFKRLGQKGFYIPDIEDGCHIKRQGYHLS